MSNMQGITYLTNLLSEANKIKESELTRTKQLAAAQRRSSNMVDLRKQQNIVQTAFKPKQSSYLEQSTQNRTANISGISELYRAAKEYNPLGSSKTEEQLKEPLTYLSKLKSDTVISALGDQLNATGTMLQGEESKLSSWKQMDSLQNQINSLKKGTLVRGVASGNHPFSYYKPATTSQLQEAEKLQLELNDYKKYHPESASERNKLIRDWNNLKPIYKDILNPQQTTLNNLIAEQEKYFGSNFANVSKEQLSAADWTAWQQLSGDVTKYTSLRDTYINKFKSDPSKYNKDWIKQYNDLITASATSMTTEIPKILQAATSTAESVKQTQQATLSSLEALDKSFGSQSRIPAEQRKVSDINTRQQVLSRIQRVGSFNENAKPTPKFEARPY